MCPRSWWVSLVPMLFVGACTPDPVLLVVDVLTDYVPGTEISDLRVEVRDGAGAVLTERTILACVDSGPSCDFLSGVRIAEVPDLEPGSYRVVTEARRAGATIARREVLVEIDADRVVTMVMARSCEGVSCASGLDCVAGVCQPFGCSVETPELCLEAVECASAMDCPGASPTGCEVARCVAGRCLLGGDSQACGSGEWCDPIGGCVPQSTSPDCVAAPDGDTIALYSFDPDVGTSTLTDSVGAHPGMILNPAGASFTVGPEGCGSALGFSGLAHAEVPDDVAWDLTEGSIDFRIWHDGASIQRGVVSRDAENQARSGHFTLLLAPSGALVARFQELTGASIWTRCGPVLSSGEWHHVGINFGAPAPELWVDGAVVDITEGSVGGQTCANVPPETGPANASGDNDNPWLIGASRIHSPEGRSDDGEEPLVGGAIDQLRVSGVRRDFSTP